MSADIMLRTNDVRLIDGRRGLSFELSSGEALAVMGKAGSGKSHLIAVLAREEKPASGSVDHLKPVVVAGDVSGLRRKTPLRIARSAARGTDQAAFVATLNALGLWDVRDEPVSRLSTSQTVACELAACFVTDAPTMLIDGQLDLLDPWTLDEALDHLDTLVSDGRAVIVATNRPEVAKRLGSVIVMDDSEAVFAGSVRSLVDSVAPAHLTVEMDDESTVKTMVEPFTVSVTASPGRLEMTSHKGQELAARLLTHGYGNVKAVIVKEPTFEDALKSV